MYLLDENLSAIDAEFSLDLDGNGPSIVIESSGGADPSRGTPRRNPKYNKLVSSVLTRLKENSIKITMVVLDSKRVRDLPLNERTAVLEHHYPIDIANKDIEALRKNIGRSISSMFQDSSAKSGGNAQKRIRIYTDRKVNPDLLISSQNADSVETQLNWEAPCLTITEKEYVTKARIGQGKFRESLVEQYQSTCPLTGLENPSLLVASHIKPWKSCSNHERLDPNNGILLSAVFDRLFDSGLISFKENGEILWSGVLSEADQKKCRRMVLGRLELSEASKRYMRFHTATIFKCESVENANI